MDLSLAVVLLTVPPLCLIAGIYLCYAVITRKLLSNQPYRPVLAKKDPLPNVLDMLTNPSFNRDVFQIPKPSEVQIKDSTNIPASSTKKYVQELSEGKGNGFTK